MYNFPVFFVGRDLEKDIKNYLENVSKKAGFYLSNSAENSDIIISSESIPDGISINEKNISLYSEGNEIFLLPFSYENVDLVIIKAVSVFNKKNPLDEFSLKMKHRYKLSKFLQGLVVTMEVEDKITNMSHSQRVAFYSAKWAEHLGKSQDEIEKIKELAMLHDIGRIGLEQLMLFTPTRINEFESWELEHTITGSVFLSSLDELWFAVPVIRNHHENWDGSGYPDGLSGDEIPYYARFIGIVDWFDISTHTASSEFEGIMSVEEALVYIEKNSGSVFDPNLSESFLEFIKYYLMNNNFI